MVGMMEWMNRKAVEVEETRNHGLLLGLTPEEVEEVVQAWVEWAVTRPHAVPWDRVRTSMILHSNGDEWRP